MWLLWCWGGILFWFGGGELLPAVYSVAEGILL